jgi:hypothetical protein
VPPHAWQEHGASSGTGELNHARPPQYGHGTEAMGFRERGRADVASWAFSFLLAVCMAPPAAAVQGRNAPVTIHNRLTLHVKTP